MPHAHTVCVDPETAFGLLPLQSVDGHELRFDRLNENLVGLVFTLLILSVVVHARKSVTCSHHCDSPDKRSLMKGEILGTRHSPAHNAAIGSALPCP